ncbi:MAG TPA: LamG domain-containing protein, partial [Polyangium sp.]|nr:LamG domain-containing protein [Polyangium sp.]
VYQCGMFGKWDLGNLKNPVQWGWDYFAGIYGGGLRGAGTDYYGFPPPPGRIDQADMEGTGNVTATNTALVAPVARRLADEYKFNRAFLDGNPDLRFYIWQKDTAEPNKPAIVKQSPVERKFLYATEDQVEDTQMWINKVKGSGPWCAALNLLTPHDPLHLPPPGTYNPANITTPANPSPQDLIVAMLESMDYYLGKLFAAIDDQLSNTVIIFMGDNGTQDIDPDTRIGLDDVLLDDKGTYSIGGVQAPMIVADGGVMKGLAPCYLGGVVPRSETTQQVHLIDIYRTVLSIAGVATMAPTDSISMAPVLKSIPGPRRTYNFSQMYDVQQAVGPDGQRKSNGYSAQLGDGTNRLICRALSAGSGRTAYFVNEQNAAAPNPVLTYQYTRLDPDAKIPGSFVDTPLPAVTRRGTGWVVRDAAYETKVLAMYQALSVERGDHLNTQFPPIGALPLVAQWVMNEGTGTTLVDRSGHNYSRPFTTAVATWVADGVKSAQVLKFNGVGAIVIGTAAALDGPTPFTLAAWIKTTSMQEAFILQQRDDTDGEYWFSVQGNGTVNFAVYAGSTFQFNITTTATVNDGQWHHIAAVRDGANGYIYIDGSLTPAAQGSGPIQNLRNTLQVAVGGDIRDNIRYFNGSMFDARIYRVALSAVEIALDLVQPLVGYWPFDECAGPIAYDKSLKAAHGTIQGTVKWNEPPRGLAFDGRTNYLAPGKKPSLSGRTPFTVSAWIRTTTGNGAIVQQRNGGFDGEYQLMIKADGTVRFWLFGEGAIQFDITTTARVLDGQWHHITAIRDATGGRIHLDGNATPAAQAASAARNLDSNISVGIGADIRDGNSYFTGVMREVRIYQAALSNALIAALATPQPK